MQVNVYRYNPDVDEVPQHAGHEIDLPEGRDLMVLDVLELLKAKDPTLAYRRSCREGVCGSDGINMNGKNGLACMTPVSTVASARQAGAAAAAGLPVVRDLVVDMTQFYRQYEKVSRISSTTRRRRPRNACRARGSRGAGRAVRVHPVRVLLHRCPSFWWNPDKFIGPAGLLQAYRFLADSRDTATANGWRTRRPVQRLSLPRHHELRERVSEGSEPDARDRQDSHDAHAAGDS